MPNRVSHFEIHADDIERCAKFYTDVFGWEIKKWDSPAMEYWMVMTGGQDEPGGINGGMLKRSGDVPKDGTGMNAFCCTAVVDDYDAIRDKILACGGSTALPKMTIGGGQWQAYQGYFKDTEGNCFGVHQIVKGGM